MHINRLSLLKRLAPNAGLRASRYVMPYLIGAQFGGAAGVAILQSPLSFESAFDLAVTFVILLIICQLIDFGGVLRRKVSNRLASSARA